VEAGSLLNEEQCLEQSLVPDLKAENQQRLSNAQSARGGNNLTSSNAASRDARNENSGSESGDQNSGDQNGAETDATSDDSE
jgi:hypothetical protein